MDNVSDEIAEVIRQLPTAQELELEALRRRVKHQRAELRRLSQKDQMFAKGFWHGSDVAHYSRLRDLMCRTFGAAAVIAAERGEVRIEEKTGG